jgi:predicted metal-dependent hydrolase
MPITTPVEASHRLTIAGVDLTYHLRRSQRRTIGLTIDQRGLRVGAPHKAQLADIEKLIHQHSAWVLDKLADWQTRPIAQKHEITDGCVISILGAPLTVRITQSDRPHWEFSGGALHLRPTTKVNAGNLLNTALREKARHVVAERLTIYASELGVATPPLRLSSARTRWGSCSPHGSIALNWRLILMPLSILDYVVCHELAHLKEMNHSHRFWSVVAQICPDWRTRRRELRQTAPQLPNF